MLERVNLCSELTKTLSPPKSETKLQAKMSLRYVKSSYGASAESVMTLNVPFSIMWDSTQWACRRCSYLPKVRHRQPVKMDSMSSRSQHERKRLDHKLAHPFSSKSETVLLACLTIDKLPKLRIKMDKRMPLLVNLLVNPSTSARMIARPTMVMILMLPVKVPFKRAKKMMEKKTWAWETMQEN